MCGLYGKDVEISVIINIRPAIPNITQRIEVDQNLPSPTGGLEPVTRQPTFGLEGDAGIEEKLRRDEIDSNIKRKLRNVYPEHTPPFYWLVSAPERSAPGTAPKHYTKEYLRIPSVQATIEEVGQRIGKGTSGIEDAQVTFPRQLRCTSRYSVMSVSQLCLRTPLSFLQLAIEINNTNFQRSLSKSTLPISLSCRKSREIKDLR